MIWVFVNTGYPIGLVGPFLERRDAVQHVAQHQYGDSYYEVISGQIAEHLKPGMDFIVTPEEDIAAKEEIPVEDR